MRTKIAFLIGLLAQTSLTALADTPKDWAKVSHPLGGQAQALGTPAAGCLMGAQELEPQGPGWQVLRLERKRNFTHPDMIQFIHWLGAQVQSESLGNMVIGDLSQPRGGPMSFGHGSHQNGLDADILFRLTDRPLTPAERERPDMISVVRGQGVDPELWTDKIERLVEIAANAPQVERIFVNPAIKSALCNKLPADQRSWLHKLRPWWGHDEHFHVRLGCPADSTECVSQKPPPEGDGCGAEVDSWLERPTLNIPSDKPNTRKVTLPAHCHVVLKADSRKNN